MTTPDLIYTSLVLPPDGHCFHCGEPLPKVPFITHVLGHDREMCCMGCQLASQSIVEAGLSQYYLDRQKISRLASMPDELALDVYNHEEIKSQFTYVEDGATIAELSVVGLRCAACTWLIESRLAKMDGVGLCQVNLTQQRMRVSWQEHKTDIGAILKAVNALGYDAKPYRADTHEALMRRDNKKMLIRLGVAAVASMQAMMFSIGIYFGDVSGMESQHREFLRYVSMVASVPVVFYSALPFFWSAWTAIKARQVNMDVPVSIALLVTFFASSFATITSSGETYFDSVAMFVFFLLAGRYVEHTARLRASSLATDLVVIAPKLVTKLGHDKTLLDDAQLLDQIDIGQFDSSKSTLVHHVQVGDIVMVDAGGEILGDGILLSERASVSQSLLTGESDLIEKHKGDTLLGGSQNDAQPLIMLISKDNDNSQIALIDRLINRAMSEKPKIAQDADKMARWFVARVLVLAVIVFGVWWFIEPSQALWATVAVLVATCPCALSLATPIALTVATNRLASKNLLVTRGHTVTTLADVSHVAFDKTGTLTRGEPDLVGIKNFSTFTDDELLAIATALELGSKHPIALALKRQSQAMHLPHAQDVTHHAGGGVGGVIGGKSYRIGHADFVLGGVAKDNKADCEAFGANMAVALSVQNADCSDEWQLLAWLYFNDNVRTDAKVVIDRLVQCGIKPIMLTGDPSSNADVLANHLGIDYQKGLLPEQKVNCIKQIQADGGRVLMVGDGINDAPVLAAADVSVSMANASELAQVSSDGVLLGDVLSPLMDGVLTAKKTLAIIRQNLRWAFFYNTIILFPAGMGYVPPWLAAIGMSLSSLGVVLNALRIKKA